MISFLKIPLLVVASEFLYDLIAKASCSCLEILYFSAVLSANTPMAISSYGSSNPSLCNPSISSELPYL